VRFLWDFGDGGTASGAQVEHEFAAMGTQTVTLTVRDQDGRQASFTRPVSAPPWPTSDVVLRLQVRPTMPVIPAGAPLSFRAAVSAQGGTEQEFELVATELPEGGLDGEGSARSRTLGTIPAGAAESGEWTELAAAFPRPVRDLHIAVSARLHGLEVAREDLIVLDSDGVLRDLHVDGARNLRRGDGALVVLRSGDAARRTASHRCVCEPGRATVNVLVFDEALGGPRGSREHSYLDFLVEALEQRYHGLKFAVRRAEPTGDEGWSPMSVFLHVAAVLGRESPNLVILVCQPETVINGVPVKEFEQAIGAALDQILVRSRAEAILVGPPPLPGRPEASRPYASAAKRMGLRKGVAVVDLYSRLLLMPDWERFFQPPGGAGRTFLLNPNERGQELIGTEILSAVVEGCHEALSAGVRQASFRRTTGGG
jgi:hypothetical protein